MKGPGVGEEGAGGASFSLEWAGMEAALAIEVVPYSFGHETVF